MLTMVTHCQSFLLCWLLRVWFFSLPPCRAGKEELVRWGETSVWTRRSRAHDFLAELVLPLRSFDLCRGTIYFPLFPSRNNDWICVTKSLQHEQLLRCQDTLKVLPKLKTWNFVKPWDFLPLKTWSFLSIAWAPGVTLQPASRWSLVAP